MLSFSLFRRALRPALAVVAALTAALALSAADAAKKNFDLPAGAAGETLKTFAKQAGREIVFSAEAVGAVSTQAVKGELAPREALEAMLADTGLVATQDAKTGAFAVRKGAGVEAKNGPSRTQAPSRAEVSGGSLTLETYTVTGSRISRLQEEGPQPTAIYRSADISARGFLTTGDFLQSLSFNSGTTNSIGVPAANPVSNVPFARGAVTMNPRGLGAGRFLVLLDGKRLSAYGLADNKGGSVFDFNSIPSEAVESIEYLKDGASAIYGSDAIAGVLNIKLKRSYSGVTASVLAGNTSGHDTFTRSASLLAGDTAGRSSYVVNVNWFKQNANFANDYARSPTTDYSAFPAPRGQNNNSTANFPFNITLTAAQAAAAGLGTGAGAYVITGGVPLAGAATLASFTYLAAGVNATTNANRYDFANATQLTPDQANLSGLFKYRYDVTPALTATATVLFSNNVTGIVYTPISINTSSSLPLSVPVNNPFNPFGIVLNSFRGRGNFGPLRTFDVESTGTTLVAGLEGKLPAGWTWGGNFIRSTSVVDQIYGNQIRTADFQSALNGTLAGFTNVFFNPFGANNPALLSALFVNSNNNSKSTTTGLDVSAGGPLFAMPALAGGESPGDVAIAVGAEWRQDKLVNNSDPVGYLVAIGDLPYRGQRTVTSAYAELAVPLVRRYLELQLAARFDRYDSFGSTVNPKFAFLSQPWPFLKLRGSYSRSFKAPDIGQLRQPAVITQTAAVVDPLNPGLGTNTYALVSAGNPALQPEKGRVWYGGLVLDLGKVAKGLSLSADYFDISISNVITTFSSPTDFFNFFPQLVARDASNRIVQFNGMTINAAGYRWQGADFGLDYRLPQTRLGDFTLNAQVTYIDTFAFNTGTNLGFVNKAGQYSIAGASPRVVGNSSLGWRRGRLGASLAAQYKGSYINNQFAPSWVEDEAWLFNGTVSCDLAKGFRATLGVNNLFDTEPPQNGKAIPSYGFDIATYAAWSLGRFVYIKVAKDF
jgi:outer membrane receptor protein involved in Fe transport